MNLDCSFERYETIRLESAICQLLKITQVPAKPTIPEMIPIIKAYKEIEGNGTGGSLHIVLDDGNIDDSSVRHCIESATKGGDENGVVVASLLLLMSKTQRKKLSNMFYAL